MKYYVLTGYEWLFFILLVGVMLCGAIRLLRGGWIRVSDIMAFRYHPLQKKIRIYMVTALFLVVSIFSLYYSSSLTARAVISLNYDGASRGLNPNSTRFNQSDMLSDEVLKRTIEKGNVEGISAAEGLKEVLEIVPLEYSDTGDDYHVSTEYSVQYHANKEAADLDGRVLVQQFCEAYREWFIEQYSMNIESLNVDYEMIEQEDYLDICDYLSASASFITNYMDTMAEKESTFYSSTIDETFQSVGSKAQNINDTMIENLRAHVMEYGVSKDVITYMGRLIIENVFLNFDAQKYQMSNANWITGIQKYADDLARIVLVPTYDTDGQFYMSQTKIGIDNFAEEAEDYADKLTETNSSMARNDHLYEQLSGNKMSEGAVNKAEGLIENIVTELEETADEARALILEYEAKQANGYMTIQMDPGNNIYKDVIKEAVRNALVLFFLLHLVCFISDLKKERAAKRQGASALEKDVRVRKRTGTYQAGRRKRSVKTEVKTSRLKQQEKDIKIQRPGQQEENVKTAQSGQQKGYVRAEQPKQQKESARAVEMRQQEESSGARETKQREIYTGIMETKRHEGYMGVGETAQQKRYINIAEPERQKDFKDWMSEVEDLAGIENGENDEDMADNSLTDFLDKLHDLLD